MLAGANQVGPTKSYPLRADFTTASIVSGRVIAIGEAAGMVNPLTGDGIDLAMDSGRIAALFLKKWFAKEKSNPADLVQYDRILRNQFQRRFRVFGLCNALVKYPFMFRVIFGLLKKNVKANRFAYEPTDSRRGITIKKPGSPGFFFKNVSSLRGAAGGACP